jgi:hypothetical protein
MEFYLLYDHVDHLLDELECAQRAYRTVYAYVKLLEDRTEQAGRVTIATAVAVTWMRPVERIIHAARMPVDTICISLNDPQCARHIERLRERSRAARTLIYQELAARDIQPDHNLLLTAGLREDLMRLETEQLLWEVVVSGKGAAVERRVVPLE